MTHILLIPHVEIQDANALASYFAIGFPAMTAWAGTVHALQRKINEKPSFKVNFKSFGITCHDFDLHTYKHQGDYISSILAKATPLNQDGSRASFIENARCSLTVSLVIECSGIPDDDEAIALFLKTAHHCIQSELRFAGGTLISHKDLDVILVHDEKSLRYLNRRLMPGYTLIERRELMEESMSEGQDAIDALLDYLKVGFRSSWNDGDMAGEATWFGERKSAGWIIPIATGFFGITDIGHAENQRDIEKLHRFAESIVTLGEFIMPYRFKSLHDMLWRCHFDQNNNLYLVQQR